MATQTTSGYTWLLTDTQRTIRLTLNNTTATRTNYYPYGALTTSSTTTTSATLNAVRQALPSEHGYLNQTHDPNHDIRLDHRTYTPTLNILTTPTHSSTPPTPRISTPTATPATTPPPTPTRADSRQRNAQTTSGATPPTMRREKIEAKGSSTPLPRPGQAARAIPRRPMFIRLPLRSTASRFPSTARRWT
ncbi:MAG: hypothetical protein R2731_00080 [Nocardioides sp.]